MEHAKKIWIQMNFRIFAELRKASISILNFKTISKIENDQILKFTKARKLSNFNNKKIEMDYFVI